MNTADAVRALLSDTPSTEEAHFRVLELIQRQPEWTQRELAEALGVSVGKVNYVLRALIDKGTVKARNFRNSRKKLAYAYLLTPKGASDKAQLAQRFLIRKLAEFEALKVEIDRLKSEAAFVDRA